jgi:hypothetical protein
MDAESKSIPRLLKNLTTLWIKLAWIVMAMVLITVGCSPSATQSIPTRAPTLVPPTQPPVPTLAPPTQPPAPTPTVALSFPTGAFTKLGWTWEFKPDGSGFIKSQWHEGLFTYTVTGNQVAFHEDIGSCRKFGPGTYTWTFDGQVLILTEVADKCADRRNLIGYGKWALKP